jgi:8-oxo-dGTP diphosphatase
MSEMIPKVGVGVMIFRGGNQTLLGKRKGSHGEGEYAFPGGHLEYGESFEECAVRETREETGIEIANIQYQLTANITKYGLKHYVHIGMTADWESGEAELLEPDKSEQWGWYPIDNPPDPLFEMSRLAIVSFRTGQIIFDLLK